MARKRQKLGEILVEWGKINKDQLDQALSIGKGSGKRIGEALIEAGFVKEQDVAKALATQFDMEYIALDSAEVADEIDLSLVPQELVKKHLVLPLSKANGRLRLVIHDPMDLELLDLLRFRLNTEIDTAIAPKSDIKMFIDGGSAGAGGSPKMFSDESLVTESVDVTVDRSVMRRAKAPASSGGQTKPLRASSTNSRTPPESLAASTGLPDMKASTVA
jgi:type IV pilus assembly protein PilB